jgi:hypothetical protein
MKYAIDYFEARSSHNSDFLNKNKTIYLASDEPLVFIEAKSKYQN